MPNSASSMATYTTLMRVTSGGRPYCQDLNDLFAALVIQHGLRDHRYRFRTIPNSFVFAEAIEVLGHLQFTHIIKAPDPADPSRLIATRTTTTFSMSPKMGKTLAQHFATSRLLENAIDPSNRVMKDKAIWLLSPKGKYVIQDFSHRARVSIQSLQSALTKIDAFNVVVLERLSDRDDRLAFARPNMTIAFKTMMAYLPMESLLADDAGGIEKKDLEEFQYAFYGYQAFEWISEYTTVVTREEAEMVASEFVLYGWIAQVIDKSDRENSTKDESIMFKMGRNTMYHVTGRGRQVLGWDKPYQYGDDSEEGSLADTHEKVLQRQRALASRLRHDTSSTKSAPTVHPTPSKKTVASSISSGSSSAESEPASDDVPHMPDDHSSSTPNSNSERHSSDKPQKDIDEVTERLLQLRSPGGVQRQRSNSASTSSSSRPSSMIFSNHDHNIDPNSHWAKLRQILQDPLIRMYFRDFLKSQFCEENVNIWVDYYTMRKKAKKPNVSTKELLQDAYAIYDTYLAPNAHSEVNIDHQLRHEIIAYVSSTFSVFNNETGSAPAGSIPFVSSAFQPTHQQQITLVVNGHASHCLRNMLKLYDRVDDHICRIMAQDSVPKFIKTEKYRELIANPPQSASVTRRNSVGRQLVVDDDDDDDLDDL
ncbi:probable regulator of g-protein signalingprotein [Lichtheimia corymbifera JMRC:FSU:9682]|uniref:Probable regulator of g-protein signalingprotein n=1 Tax=Lichtheimia corymbifera JMRC:FSU:9682 TaxID=1263082 RepID=A0A068S6B3_9FUNG|nr:probable regulator of g-protein signalingprotein [Lichtheimia corymbifera JMRC:FSU:9682]